MAQSHGFGSLLVSGCLLGDIFVLFILLRTVLPTLTSKATHLQS